VEKAMQIANSVKVEPPSLTPVGITQKKSPRSGWASNARAEHASRVWLKPDFQKAVLGLSEPYVVRPVRTFGPLVAVSAAMQGLFELLERFARTQFSVTLLGETGTGKDVIAHALHAEGVNARGPFVVFDCGAVAPNLAESELLGHERGAFTGAISAHAGAFERANGGTLFLDEIGDLPLDLQPRLLRVLEARSVRRVGGTKDRPLDVRIICATHRDLRAAVAAGQFRQDLYFRLAAAVVAVPPLRDRLEDLPLLASSLLEDLGYGHLKINERLLKALRAHTWPGNVRELKNALACAAAFVDEAGILDPNHLRLLQAEGEEPSAIDRLPLGGQTLERIERIAIQQTMARTRGNKVHAAQALGIAVSTLYEKLKKYSF
jgi:transcriptional regulator with PAS, ATPase and Fis domain